MIRRTFHRIALAAALAAPFGAALAPATLHAAAAQKKVQAPGWQRTMVGDIEVTAILDATIPLTPAELLTGMPKDQVNAKLKESFLPEAAETSVTGYLVNTGKKLVLVDTGSGTSFGYKPQFLANLRAAGYTPEQVDEVYITHMHGDHVGGLAVNGKRTFPNATLRIDKADTDFWLSPEVMKQAPEQFKMFFQLAQTVTKPYIAAGKLKPFEGQQELVPGVTAVPTHGHTPGHTVYRVESKGQTLILWGDLMHVAAVQFENPQVAIQFDSDSKAAIEQRQKAFAEAADKGWMVGAAHLPFPGLGHIRSNGKGGYTYQPLNYSTLQPAK